MEDMNDILNTSTAVKETALDKTVETTETPEAEKNREQETKEAAQPAAETQPEHSTDPVKSELAALVAERRRVKQKETALDEERARLFSTASAEPEKKEEQPDAKSELKDLRKQHREALKNSLLDAEDEEAAQLVEELEDKMDELRSTMANQAYRTMTAQEKAVHNYESVHEAVHVEFPFLDPNHPRADRDLNDNINTYMAGRLQNGDSRDVALRKAVDLFAPAYAKSLGDDGEADPGDPARTKKEEADKLVRQKLAKGGFSEVRSVGRAAQGKFSGPTPMAAILGKSPPG
jgi:myosin heavy subunit